MSVSSKEENTWLWMHRILMPILMVILTIVVSIGGFIGTKVWDRVENGLNNLDERIDVLEVTSAKNDSNKFTAQHWVDAKSRMDEDRAIIDRRITRLEEAIPQIKESLLRIENKIERQ